MFGLMWVRHCLVIVIFLWDTESFSVASGFFFLLFFFTEPANYLSSKLGSHSRLNSKDVIVCGCLCVWVHVFFWRCWCVSLCALSLPLFVCFCVCVCLVSEQICIVHKHLSCCSLLGKFCYKLKLCRCSWFCIHPFDLGSWLNLFVCLSYCSHVL